MIEHRQKSIPADGRLNTESNESMTRFKGGRADVLNLSYQDEESFSAAKAQARLSAYMQRSSIQSFKKLYEPSATHSDVKMEDCAKTIPRNRAEVRK